MPTLSNSQKTRILTIMGEHIAHTRLLGVELVKVDGEELTLKLPYQENLIGDAESGTLHGGVITVLLDQCLGMSALCCDATEPAVAPTLDLRIDHLGVAPAGRDIYATARVYKATRKLLFMEGSAYCESKDEPIARATGSWVRMAPVQLSWFLDEVIGDADE